MGSLTTYGASEYASNSIPLALIEETVYCSRPVLRVCTRVRVVLKNLSLKYVPGLLSPCCTNLPDNCILVMPATAPFTGKVAIPQPIDNEVAAIAPTTAGV